jgi:RimJ/RimL family protein N-acetyltransferase
MDVRTTMLILEGTHVRLEPLTLGHLDALCEVGLDDDLWRFFPKPVHSREDMQDYMQTALQWQADGTAIPLVTIERSTQRIVGSTRFMNIDRPNRHVEIGATWVARPWQRTAVNTEAKYLMLRHAFEELRCIRVELKTDELNQRSRNAILRIGAKQEGIFRNHMVCAGGRLRNSVWFSIIDSEWPGVKASLEEKLRE